MWTPKRVLVLAGGVVLFVILYVVYSRVLGGIDGLPPLPEAYYPDSGPVVSEPAVPLPNDIEKKLLQAFDDCDEIRWPIKLDVRSRGMVLAAREFFVEGPKVKLSPFSLALFRKQPGGGHPEIHTIRSKVAYVTFDGPVANPWDMGKRKIVAAEMIGPVVLTNNHKTAPRDDDLSLTVPSGTVFYSERDNRIWTAQDVMLVDLQSRPQPTRVKATGMDVRLAADPPAAGPGGAKKPRPENASGVECVRLHSDVSMEMYVDAKSGLLAGGKGKPEADARPFVGPPAPGRPEAAPEKSKLVITTHGPFRYDVAADVARFDVPPDDGRGSQLPECVRVTRFHDDGRTDKLECDHLTLQLRRKPPPEGAAGKEEHGQEKETQKEERGQEKEIQSVHATGKAVLLTSDAESFCAGGNDFFHDAVRKETTLKGDPAEGMWAIREGSEIHARELRLLDLPEGTQATALGPGTIKPFDAKTGKRPLEASWKDKLVTSKDDGCDLFVLTGTATFVDLESDPPRRLKGETIKVWRKGGDPRAKDKGGAAKAGPVSTEQHGRQLHKLEAAGEVVLSSRELEIHRTEHLVVHFRDAPADAATSPAPDASAPAPKPLIPQPDPAAPAAPQAPGGGPPQPAPPARPLELTARAVKATVLRSDNKNELSKLWTEGQVHVRQEPAAKEDKGVDITGDTLDLTHRPEGSLLVVSGDLARLQLNKIYIEASEVSIDQASNHAWVDGKGRMVLESNTNFQGDKIARPVPLEILWDKMMNFHGQNAIFRGQVQAAQDNSQLLCQELQVQLDRPVSFKEGDALSRSGATGEGQPPDGRLHQGAGTPRSPRGSAEQGGEKGSQPPRVSKLVCNQAVQVYDKTLADGQTAAREQWLVCGELDMDNLEGIIKANPGVVRILQPGGEEMQITPGGTSRKPPPDAKTAGQLKLTQVKYTGRMWANSNKRLVTFTDNVEVYHLPAKKIDDPIDEKRLPPEGFYLRCNQLQVLNRLANVRAGQEMIATGRVTVQGQDFFGQAEKVSYDEAKDQVIFDGEKGQAYLAKSQGQGKPPQEVVGKKIIYIRSTGAIFGEGLQTIRGGK